MVTHLNTQMHIYLYTDIYLERHKGRQERFCSSVQSQYKDVNGVHYLSLKVGYIKYFCF